MDAASQQKILGYFIEEAKEHLETLEEGLLNLSTVVHDSERVNELFRAAHSVKGGAAMLGYTSIQKTAHRLEDAFKIFKENEIPVDQKLVSLFLASYDVLHDLLERLQGPFGLQDEEANQIVEKAQPNFAQLQQYLNHLVSGGAPEGQTPPVTVQPASIPTETTSTRANQVRDLLKQMLALFKQKSTKETRQQLQKICIELAKLSKEVESWQNLLKTAHKAIGNPQHSYRVLAPVVITSIKQGSDLMELGNPDAIKPSESLQRLASAKTPQILVTVEPKLAAQTLLKAFNKQQVSQLVKLLAAN